MYDAEPVEDTPPGDGSPSESDSIAEQNSVDGAKLSDERVTNFSEKGTFSKGSSNGGATSVGALPLVCEVKAVHFFKNLLLRVTISTQHSYH